ncbi:Diacylglycerol O-acyltransferase 2 [Bagarius yarrelli]|uniref:Acyltransferase n=1 Tax=Bagarius yarrelli TaxID=175774 RepID=A0A556TYM7_BAGYA|nr:Diacylglycerol O-acyltransferase 2 [Bagarius yarrelli]
MLLQLVLKVWTHDYAFESRRVSCLLVAAVEETEENSKKSQWKLFMEDISVLQLVLSFLLMAVACLVLMLYLMFTPLWPIPTLYFTWQFFDWDTPERGGRKTHFVRRWPVWRHFKDYFPVKLVKTAELSPSKNYILGCHPHGIMSMGAFSCFSTEAGGFAHAFPGVRSSLAVLAGLFRMPLFREYLMFGRLLPVSKECLEYVLSRGDVGNAVVIIIGGAEESLASSPGVNTVVMKQRKGFVRLALENGADLVPVYSFGENELFPQVMLSEGSVGRRLQALFKQVMGFAPCLFTGGRWLLLPYRRPVTTVVGSPISVPQVCNPSEQQVDLYHKLYMESLSELFHQHKTSCGLADTHQLRII